MKNVIHLFQRIRKFNKKWKMLNFFSRSSSGTNYIWGIPKNWHHDKFWCCQISQDFGLLFTCWWHIDNISNWGLRWSISRCHYQLKKHALCLLCCLQESQLKFSWVIHRTKNQFPFHIWSSPVNSQRNLSKRSKWTLFIILVHQWIWEQHFWWSLLHLSSFWFRSKNYWIMELGHQTFYGMLYQDLVGKMKLLHDSCNGNFELYSHTQNDSMRLARKVIFNLLEYQSFNRLLPFNQYACLVSTTETVILDLFLNSSLGKYSCIWIKLQTIAKFLEMNSICVTVLFKNRFESQLQVIVSNFIQKFFITTQLLLAPCQKVYCQWFIELIKGVQLHSVDCRRKRLR